MSSCDFHISTCCFVVVVVLVVIIMSHLCCIFVYISSNSFQHLVNLFPLKLLIILY